MTRPVAVVLAILLGVTLSACTSGTSTPTCSLSDPATLQLSPAMLGWPKFRHDVQNTGTIVDSSPSDPDLSTNMGQCIWAFPPLGNGACGSSQDEMPAAAKGAFTASPVLNLSTSGTSTPSRLYIGSTDGTMYALRLNSDNQGARGTQDTSFNLAAGPPAKSITSTALVGVRDGKDAVFVGAGNGILYGVDDTGLPQATNWPYLFSGFVRGSPDIGPDGTVYEGALTGLVAGVCPNGIPQFVLSTIGVQASPAVGPDGTIYIGADDSTLRAFAVDGTIKWAFSVAGPILNAPVVDATGSTTNAVYVADSAGYLFQILIDSNGQPTAGFKLGPFGRIESSPALTPSSASSTQSPQHRLYFGSDDGNLYAVDIGTASQTAQPAWSIPTGGSIASSPAVTVNSDGVATLVVGSDDGKLYFVRDDGGSGTIIRTFSIPDQHMQAGDVTTCATGGTGTTTSPCAVESSPAIGVDGTVYIGADDGRVYAIGSASVIPTPTP